MLDESGPSHEWAALEWEMAAVIGSITGLKPQICFG
jgi:hypothetical protein